MFVPTKSKNIKTTLEGQHFLTLQDFTKEEILFLLDYALELKEKQRSKGANHLLEGKTLGMIFEKSSTRTRVSFETGMFQLGGHALFLSKNDIHLGKGETIADTAKVLSRYVDGIMIRTFEHALIEELAENASIPIINGLTDDFHPCQVLADLLTIYEKKGNLEGNKLAFVGDGHNMANSLIIGCAMMGIDCSLAVPKGYEVKDAIMDKAKILAAQSGAVIEQSNDPKKAVENADIIYTDVWTSMGCEDEMDDRMQAFAKYQVNQELVQYAKDDYLFLHCLPAVRGQEMTTDIIDGPNSVVFDQAENRLHAQKAVMASVMGGN
ncbi:ornithine carbamoyltransferase [Virgibacillus alimentarius]|uniref:Ornithine carbamoyltransferase n=1 Tax=Virgibacillus alimentarius TaxID=698769 RepID=A0ABS4S5I6_9BACI|nr:ornithine carbamoyltransferase [Virgibacillus alimentarius]MBP2256755.1 ornithine carbamoyltransferase [Virgibacillus alimentarius]